MQVINNPVLFWEHYRMIIEATTLLVFQNNFDYWFYIVKNL